MCAGTSLWILFVLFYILLICLNLAVKNQHQYLCLTVSEFDVFFALLFGRAALTFISVIKP